MCIRDSDWTTQPCPGQEKRCDNDNVGAPGWNRTSDTRFRKHAEGVTGRSASCAKVLHSPRFCAGSVTARAKACWAVVMRLVGNSAATALPGDRPCALCESVSDLLLLLGPRAITSG